LAAGDVSGSKSDLAKVQADLKAQTTSNTSNNFAQDVTSLFNDLASGNSSATKTDVTKLTEDLQAQEASITSNTQTSTQTVNPLENLLSNISDSLNSGSTQGALQDLANYLVQNGQAAGSLVNTSA
jgi:translation initiation factor 2B subunit (eIF-2B alpha/beta/delta family)